MKNKNINRWFNSIIAIPTGIVGKMDYDSAKIYGKLDNGDLVYLCECDSGNILENNHALFWDFVPNGIRFFHGGCKIRLKGDCDKGSMFFEFKHN